MTLVRGIRAGGALAVLLLVPQLAPAAWDNVFQVTCFGCRKQATSAYYAPPPCNTCPAPCPCPTTTAYVQRTYYQPVTTYQAETHYEPVTSYRTSYYYEPVTSYTYSSYYDPCSCSCQQVATPVTSYRLRSQCNACVNYVARVSYKPVTSYRQSCYMEAVQVPACPAPCPTCPAPCPTCPTAAPAIAPAAAAIVAPAAPPANTQAPPLNLPSDPAQPGLSEQRQPAPTGAGLEQQRNQYYPQMPSLQSRPTQIPAVPSFKPERVASRTLPGSTVNGQVVSSNFAPKAGAQIVFVNAAQQDVRATADATGRFQVSLASGNWTVYLADNNGGLAYHNQFTVSNSDSGPLTVVSR
jgi:hypothetical protein